MHRHWNVIALVLIVTGVLPAETPRPAGEAAIKAQLNGYATARTKGDGHAQASGGANLVPITRAGTAS